MPECELRIATGDAERAAARPIIVRIDSDPGIVPHYGFRPMIQEIEMARLLYALLSVLAAGLSGCDTGTVPGCDCSMNRLDSGSWAQQGPDARIVLTWLEGGRFETILSKAGSSGDSIISDEVFRYAISSDSALIHYELDTVLAGELHAAPEDTVNHAYFRLRNDTLLMAPTAPAPVFLRGSEGHSTGSLFGEWADPRFPGKPLVIKPDSTGTYAGFAVRFKIDADRIIYQGDGDQLGDGAFYYRVEASTLELWQAKYDCSDSGCRIDNEYNLVRIR